MFSFFRSQLRPPPCVTVTAIREKHRKMTKLKLRLLGRRMKLLKLSKMGLTLEDLKKKKTFEERLAERRAKMGIQATSESIMWPSRYLPMATVNPPSQGIYRISHYNRIVPLDEAIEMNREMQHPTIYNNPKVQLMLRLDLNTNLDIGSTSFVENVSKVIALPHRFNLKTKRTIMAFAGTLANLDKARDAGAEFLVGPDSLKKVMKGVIKITDVDFFVANMEIIQEMTILRGVLKYRFPTVINGALGLDIADRVDHFKHGVIMNIKRDEIQEGWGVAKAAIGTLDQPNEHLEANIKSYISQVCAYRTQAKSLGHFISRAVVYVAEFPKEYHVIDFEKYAPPVPDHDQNLEIEEADKKKKKKEKKRQEWLEKKGHVQLI